MLLLSGLLSSQLAWAQQVPASTVNIGINQESLNNNRPNWQQQDIQFKQGFGPRALWEVGVRSATRGSLRDTEFNALIALPVAVQWSAQLSFTTAQSPQFLPKQSVRLDLSYQLGQGWVSQALYEHRQYTGNGRLNAHLFGFGIEKYWQRWRFAGLVNTSRSNLGSIGSSVRLQADYDFAERSKIAVIASAGKELDSLAPSATSYSVRSFVLLGSFPLSSNWALKGELGRHQTGDLYTRLAARLGLEYQF